MTAFLHRCLYLLWILTALTLINGSNVQIQIPSVVSFVPADAPPFILSSTVRIFVDAAYAHMGSPSLHAFAITFRKDLIAVSGFTNIEPVLVGPQNGLAPAIFLTLGATNHTLFNHKGTDEGYEFTVNSGLYVIKGVRPIGSWWGTRTLLQQLVLSKSSADSGLAVLPAGSGSDAPGWEVRGFMLDAGRHWFETSFLADLCTYASFFKINEFHIHASDNLWNPAFLYGAGNEGWKHLYAGFRFLPPLGSPIEGLVPLRNESWSKDAFTELQTTCAAHGVMIIPEIDTPGHSLAISQWKPELMLAGEPDDLDLSHPDTIPTIKAIWSEFLPWFATNEVSIGADEYDASLANEYISFVNEMSVYIHAQSGKSIRIWGTHEPSDTLTVSTNITIQHWDFPDDSIPVQLVQSGYDIINSEQYFLYLDGKTSDSGQFPQELNDTLMWEGAPSGAGWAPNIFSPTDPSNNTAVDDPHVRGAIFALWSDWGNNATTQLEVYYQLARSIAVFAEKTWAGDGVLTRDAFESVYGTLNAAAPGQNLNRAVIPENGDVVYTYDLRGHTLPITTPYPSVGPPYTLTFAVNPHTSTTGTLFSGPDSTLHVQNLTFEAGGTHQRYALNCTLPVGEWTTVTIHATREYTYAIVDGKEGTRMFWETTMDIWGEYMAVGNMSFAAPAGRIGGDGFEGEIGRVELRVG
ncbi:glycoside hydrolase family 20 protein [Ramaria rubella]|nr:glycoside hydrolase family 20 protein [Ramaria rubella]